MNRKFKSLLYGLISASTAFFTSCSKELDTTVYPNNQQEILINNGVKVQNGRVVFVDDATFIKIRQEFTNKTYPELDKWEESLGFSSLRKLDNEDKEFDEEGLMNEFHFPASYATIINRKGEYQVGNKIYWFHNGFKHEASSEEELNNIKENPSLSTKKFKAGATLVSKTVQQGSTASRSDRAASNTIGDRKFVRSFNWDGRERRLTIETFIYNEAYSGQLPSQNAGCGACVGPYALGGTYYTALVLSIYREYYNRRWYRGGEPLIISYNINYVGFPSNTQSPYSPYEYIYTDWNLPRSTKNFTEGYIYYTGSGNYTRDLDATYVLNTSFNPSHDWNYDVNGNIKVRIAANNDLSEEFEINGQLW